MQKKLDRKKRNLGGGLVTTPVTGSMSEKESEKLQKKPIILAVGQILSIAEACHNANKAYCESIGDTSQPSWQDAPENIKNSVISGVRFHLNNPNAKPEDSHNNWLKDKTADGWKYGEVKNMETKEHPCFVPYNELPEDQQKKDSIFILTVHEMATNFLKSTKSVKSNSKNSKK